MSAPKDRAAYSDCYDVLDQALISDRGIQVAFKSRDEAKAFRFRLNNARKLDRELNRQIYEPGHPMHGASEYSALIIRVLEGPGRSLCRIEKAPPLEIEEIPDDPGRDLGEG